jgi:ribosomal silencing factor RsfS
MEGGSRGAGGEGGSEFHFIVLDTHEVLLVVFRRENREFLDT